MNRALVLAACLTLLAACGDETGGALEGDSAAEPELTSCQQAFSDAAAISDFEDSQDDVEPTFFACQTIGDWVAAEKQFKISGGLAGRIYAVNQCRFNQDVKQSPVCLDLRSK